LRSKRYCFDTNAIKTQRLNIILIILTLMSIFVSAQERQIGIINDPDGYVNIRQDKSAQSKVIGKICEGDRFYYYSVTDSDWWKIQTYYGNQSGYVHKSRIADYYVKNSYCQCLLFDQKQTDLPNFQFSIGDNNVIVCGYLKQRYSKDKIKISEFSITDCQKNKMIIFYSALQTCYIEKFSDKVKITELSKLPFGENWTWNELPYKEREIFLNSDNELILGDEKPVLDYHIANDKIDDYLKSLDKLKENKNDLDFETTIGALLKCALNDNQKAKEILFDFNNYFGVTLDGAFLEFHNDAITIYNWIMN